MWDGWVEFPFSFSYILSSLPIFSLSPKTTKLQINHSVVLNYATFVFVSDLPSKNSVVVCGAVVVRLSVKRKQ